MPRLRQNEKDRAVGNVQAGIRHIDVSEHFGVSRLTTVHLMSLGWATGVTAYGPLITTLRQDRQIRLVYLYRDRSLQATVTANQTPGDTTHEY